MTERPSSRRHFSRIFAVSVLALAIIGAGVFVFERCTSWPARTAKTTVDQMERMGRDLRDALVQVAQLQPRVTINNRVYFEQSSEITELALVSQRLEVEHEFLHKWAGSTKRLRLHGNFTVKAGFDLRQQFNITVQPQEAVVRLPHAQILGVEQESVEVLAFENGLWNPISGADVQTELTTLQQLARDRAAERHLPADAERTLRSQLATRIPDFSSVHIIFYDAVKRD